MLLLLCSMAFAQTDSRRNLAYFELGGNGLYTSINYERIITKKQKFGIHAGVGRYKDRNYFLTIPIGLRFIKQIKRSSSYLDLGFGATYSRNDVQLYVAVKRNLPYDGYKNNMNIVPSLGYRQYIKNRLMFRMAFTPVINEYGFIPYFGICVGGLF